VLSGAPLDGLASLILLGVLAGMAIITRMRRARS
jgi:hypothetical protein